MKCRKRIVILVILIGILMVATSSDTVLVWKINPEVQTKQGTTYMKFPIEQLRELPEEPDWKVDAEAWEDFEKKRQDKDMMQKIDNFIQEEVKRSGTDAFIYINANGDVMINMHITANTVVSKMQDEVFYRSKDNNLVRVQIDNKGTIRRTEYCTKTRRLNRWKDERYTIFSEILNEYRAHWRYENGELYYLIKDTQEWKQVKVAEGNLIDGISTTVNGRISYPLIERDGKLYLYTVQDAIPYHYAYYVTNGIQITEIELQNEEGTCNAYKNRDNKMEILAKISDYNIEFICEASDILLEQKNQDFSECFQEIQKLGYMEIEYKSFYYCKKNGTPISYFY